jgi:dihydrofolate reductase
MSRLRVHCFALSADGYGAGPRQSEQHPLGVGGLAMHSWQFATRSFTALVGGDGASTGVDDGFVARGFDGIGAWIMGRNMFGPVRGPWPNDDWKGWWGSTPPFRTPVFILTRHARPSFQMDGGTTFHFITGGIQSALDAARTAAGPRDVRLGGGVETVRQYLKARLIDELHLAITPILLGSGEHLLSGIDATSLGYQVKEQTMGEGAMHIVLHRQG